MFGQKRHNYVNVTFMYDFVFGDAGVAVHCSYSHCLGIFLVVAVVSAAFAN